MCPRPTELTRFFPFTFHSFWVRQAELNLLAEETKKILEQREVTYFFQFTNNKIIEQDTVDNNRLTYIFSDLLVFAS